MPELPEVETVRRALGPRIRGQRIVRVVVRQPRLRWPVSPVLRRHAPGQRVQTVQRRGKYLLLGLDAGTVILHLGMSGSLRILNKAVPPEPHDHLDLCFHSGRVLRLRDPRRFGSVHWTRSDPQRHRLLRNLGPEPLTSAFNGDYLYHSSRGRRLAMKTLLMDARVVAGIGNIYANEALFVAGVHPARHAGRVSRLRCDRLVEAVRDVLRRAIHAGGTTLRDFRHPGGAAGYFRVDLKVYGREGQPCVCCGTLLRRRLLNQRSCFYCPLCQR